MTTCDASITAALSDWRCTVSNGLGGPATGLLLAMINAVRAGEAQGSYNEASVQAECDGRLLLELLPQLAAQNVWESWKLHGQRVPVKDIVAALLAEHSYRVEALEV